MPAPIRVVFYTNLTNTVNLTVLRALANSEKIELSHVFFYDTIKGGQSSILVHLSEIGVRRMASKVIALISSRVRLGLGKILGAERLGGRSSWEYANINHLSFSVIEDLNKGAALQRLKDLAPQVLVVCACKNILKKSVLEIQGLQAVNLHPSLLPNYRGPTPTFWMRYNGEPETGMTFHLMTPRIDVGPILLQYKVPLDRMLSEESTETELFTEAARHVEDVVMQVVRGEFPEQSQLGSGSYHSFPNSDDRRELSLRLSSLKSTTAPRS